jgi:hypothetical protein
LNDKFLGQKETNGAVAKAGPVGPPSEGRGYLLAVMYGRGGRGSLIAAIRGRGRGDLWLSRHSYVDHSEVALCSNALTCFNQRLLGFCEIDSTECSE